MSKSMLSRDMHSAVAAELKKGCAATDDREFPTVTAGAIAAKVAKKFGVPKDGLDDLRILLTQAVKLGCLEGYENQRGRFGGICRVSE